MEHFNVTFEPDNKRISIHAGATLIEAASQAGIILNSVCGGKGTCKKCLVKLEPDGGEVLACQYYIQTDLTVTIPHFSRFLEQKILEHGIDRQIKVQPTVSKEYVKIESPDPQELQALLNRTCASRPIKISPNVTEQLKTLDWQSLQEGLTVVCHLDRDCDKSDLPAYKYTAVTIEHGDTTDKIFGVAADVGTTTVVAKLVNMADGKCHATQAALNPQSQWGDDVISRIAYGETDAKLAELHQLIIDCVNELIDRLCRQASVEAKYIYEMCVVGNTTMNHIFLKLPIKQLGQAPYKAFSLEAHDRSAEELAVQINPAGNIHTVENIAGFVGSDATAVALAVDIDSAEDVTLAVDIGTNGELVLAAGDKLYAASCAAGPAFEGARIKCGSGAVEGAIQAVVINNGDIDLDVIGNCAPRWICGSGLVDAVAVLLDLGVIDATGRFVEPQNLRNHLPLAILSRIIEQGGQLAFCLAGPQEGDAEKVVLTQRDIRQVQLAKGAIRAGVTLLERKTGIEDNDIKQIFLAGAFGNYIRPGSAVRIGLLPDVPGERIHFVGNAASSGAQMILLSWDCREIARRLARKIEYVEIAHEPEFQSVFAESMGF